MASDKSMEKAESEKEQEQAEEEEEYVKLDDAQPGQKDKVEQKIENEVIQVANLDENNSKTIVEKEKNLTEIINASSDQIIEKEKISPVNIL